MEVVPKTEFDKAGASWTKAFSNLKNKEAEAKMGYLSRLEQLKNLLQELTYHVEQEMKEKINQVLEGK